MSNAVLRRGGEVLAAALVVAFVSLRCMELVDVYCQSRLHLVLHAGLALVAASRPGLPRVTLLSVLYGVMRHRVDVQVYAAPAGTSLAGAIVVIAGASSEILCRKQGLYGRPAPPQPADRSRLTKAPGSIVWRQEPPESQLAEACATLLSTQAGSASRSRTSSPPSTRRRSCSAAATSPSVSSSGQWARAACSSTWRTCGASCSLPASCCVKNEAHQGLARMAPSRLHQRQRMPGVAPRCGPLRPISLLGRAGQPHRPCVSHRRGA